MNAARAGLVLLAVVAACAGAPTASASDTTCPTAAEPDPVTGEVVAVRWHGGAGFAERCASTTGARAAEPVAEAAAATAPPSQTATPAPKAAQTKKAKPKRKSKRAHVRAKCVRRR